MALISILLLVLVLKSSRWPTQCLSVLLLVVFEVNYFDRMFEQVFLMNILSIEHLLCFEYSDCVLWMCLVNILMVLDDLCNVHFIYVRNPVLDFGTPTKSTSIQ